MSNQEMVAWFLWMAATTILTVVILGAINA
jgi:hypothetical protein